MVDAGMLGDVIKLLEGGSEATAAPRIAVPKIHQKTIIPFSSSSSSSFTPFTSSGTPTTRGAEKGIAYRRQVAELLKLDR